MITQTPPLVARVPSPQVWVVIDVSIPTLVVQEYQIGGTY